MKKICRECGSVTIRVRRSFLEKVLKPNAEKRRCVGCDHVEYLARTEATESSGRRKFSH